MARPRPIRPVRAVDRIISSEGRVRSPGTLGGVVGRAERVPVPEDYFQGMDWSALCLPKNILCFLRDVEVHELRGWGGFSTRSGKFDCHERFVLLTVLEGAGTIGVDAKVFSLEEGEALLLFPHQVHYYLAIAKQFSWLFQTFTLDEQQIAPFTELRDSPRVVSRKARRLLNQSLDGYNDASSGRDLLGVSLLLGELIGGLHECAPVEREVQDLDLVARVRTYVFNRLEEGVNLEIMAGELGLPSMNLKDEFRRATGDSLGGFVRSVRLVLAANLLSDATVALESVAGRCGFKSEERFQQAFGDVYRLSPADFRSANVR